MGLTEEDKKKSFHASTRHDKARSRERGGDGLELSIARGNRAITVKIMTSRLNHGSLFK